MEQLDRDIITFYRRWDALEGALATGGLVIDWDLAPPTPEAPPYDTRFEALRALNKLQDRLESDTDSRNEALLEAKLHGAETYLRALMGERTPFETYLRETMGIAPSPVPAQELANTLDDLAVAFGARGVHFGTDTVREQFRAAVGREFDDELPKELNAHAAAYVGDVRTLLDLAEPRYTVEVVREDAYWTNWIDGSAESGLTLKINTHPRIEYDRWSARRLAAHEIAGHALHVAGLLQAAAAERIRPAILVASVHSVEAFHTEGLAQIALEWLSVSDGSLDEDAAQELHLMRTYHQYVLDRLNVAQLQIEAGLPIDGVCAGTARDCPLTKPLKIWSDLRDRSRSPLMRSYGYVYAPSRRAFLRSMLQEEETLTRFLADAYRTFYTPDELRERTRPTAVDA